MREKLKVHTEFHNAMLQKAQRYSPNPFQCEGEIVRKAQKNGDRTGRGIAWKIDMGVMRE
jgi:hypothetical protein